jgi:hypothetical protein
MIEQKHLDDTQLAAFDREYIHGVRWSFFQTAVESQFSDVRSLRFLDIGGGAGHFATRVRAVYPGWSVHVLDISDILLNVARSKGIIITKGSVLDDVPDRFVGAFDVVSANLMLHHLIGVKDAQTTTNVARALSNMRKLVAPEGLVSVFEDNYLGYVFHDWPGRLIYELTQRQGIAPQPRRFGANTAGVGVRFRSARAWRGIFESDGFAVRSVNFDTDIDYGVGRVKKCLLNIKELNSCHFYLTPLARAS